MNQLKQILYSYEPNEFLPIYDGSELINKRQFVIYKFRRAAGRCGVTHDNMETLGNKIDKVFTSQGFLPPING